MMKEQIQSYLERISYDGPVLPNLQILAQLQYRHLFEVPFENLDIHLGQQIVLDRDRFYTKIVDNKRGGFCFEVNSLFQWLLEELGFKSHLISCAVYSELQGGYTHEGGHASIIVVLDGIKWLVDVGFGDGIQQPLSIESKEPAYHGYRYYRVDTMEDGRYQLMKSEDLQQWTPMYRFRDLAVSLGHFESMCHYQQTSPDSLFTQHRLCTKLVKEGRITLAGDRLIITREGERSERKILTDEFERLLDEHFSIRIEATD